MSISETELYVYYIEREGNKIIASARCGEQDIYIGDIFKHAYCHEYINDSDESKKQPPPIKRRVVEVNLRIDYMERYQEAVTVLKLGDTAKVVLSGEGVELVGQERDVLSTD